MTRRICLAALTVVGGCMTSPRANEFLPAVGPSGVHGDVYLVTDSRAVPIELLAIDDSSFVALARNRVAVIPFRVVTRATFDQIGRVGLALEAPSDDDRRHLRYASRFPYGVSAAVMARLLEATHQTRPDNLGAPSDTLAPNERRIDEFIEQARIGTSRYRDQRVAIAAGFHRVGVDFPAMGEHWINIKRILADTFDAATPPILIYARIDGTPTLSGVAYTALLEPGESTPSFAPARGYWHEHNGTVVEESFAVAPHAGATDSTAPRLAILHAWVWTENPDGVFVTDNWALPYARAGIPLARAARPELAAALALAAGTIDYYLLAARVAGSLSPGEELSVEHILRVAAEQAASDLARARAKHAIDAGDEQRLTTIWRDTWVRVAATVPPDRAGPVAALAYASSGAHSAPHH